MRESESENVRENVSASDRARIQREIRGMKFRVGVGDSQPPICTDDKKFPPSHIGYGDLYVYKGGSVTDGVTDPETDGETDDNGETHTPLSVIVSAWCYPCAVTLTEVNPLLHDTIHRVMGQGISDKRILAERARIMSDMGKFRIETLKKLGGRWGLAEARRVEKEIQKRTGEEWGARLKFLFEARGMKDVEIESVIDLGASTRMERGGPCPCGCKGITRAGSNFLPGHDSRFYSKWRKWLEAEIEDEDLSEDTMREIIARTKRGDDPWH